jgi:hypothetical protein
MNTILVVKYEAADGEWKTVPASEAFNPRWVEWMGEEFNLQAAVTDMYGPNARIVHERIAALTSDAQEGAG